MPSLDSLLRQTKRLDKKYLKKTAIPLVTVSGTYREDLKGLYDLPENDLKRDLVFSRAHYSMAIGAAITAWSDTIDPHKLWFFDPTNYVSSKNWSGVLMTENIGRLVARIPLLKIVKNFVDKFGRGKLPILASITPPLMRLTKDVNKPILSFHVVAGNLLLEKGKTVMQMVTDPHVREEYVLNSDKPHAYYGVFDENTKAEFIEKATKLGKKVATNRVIVTGPPIDPRIMAAVEHKKSWSKKSNRPLRICLTTGGLGTNKAEIETIIKQLLPELAKPNCGFQLMVYAGTHADIKDMVIGIARQCDCQYQQISGYDPADFAIGAKIDPQPPATEKMTSSLAVIYHPQIIDANELLIRNGFPWADGFITKPSGDMAYDAVASGAFLLTLKEWGEWENNIRIKFKGHGVAQVANPDNIVDQLKQLMRDNPKGSWITQAMKKTRIIEQEDPYFRQGTKNIIKAIGKIT